MRSIVELEKRIQCLELENQYLKKLLADAGISYSEKAIDDNVNKYDPDQGSRIIPRDITETDAKEFFSMFWGRTDVYSKRTIKKSTGEVNYYTQCHNFWKNGCPRITGSRIKYRDCQRQALKEGNSAFIDEYWNSYPDQWEVLLNKKKISKEFIEKKIKEWTEGSLDIATGCKDIFENDNERPWDRTKHFHKQDVEGILQITLSNGVYVNTVNLQPRIQNQIRRMAAFSNPVFYKNQAMRLSNFENYRYIYLGSDEGEFIKVPRGILENITEECEKTGIEYVIEDKRSKGHPIHVEFIGELKESQIPAVEKLLRYENRILNAATAFGKTVVCCNVIAKKQVNTLILLQSSALMEQWREALERFLYIDEELPDYETPTGRKKKRKSLIGKLQGAHDSTTGIMMERKA